jgi:nucleoid-associated protein YgaU
MNFRIFRLVAVLLALGFVVGCASTQEPATQEDGAQASAQAAIDAAKKSAAEAKALGFDWTTTDDLIKKAESAYKAGVDSKSNPNAPAGEANAFFAEAEAHAKKAKELADESIGQYYLQQAKFKIEKIKAMGGLTDDQKAMLAEAEAYYAQAKGREAYDAITALEASLAAGRIVYTVETGDNLWNISAKDTIYGNPYQWPLIYKANADQIKDPDLIFPGQEFGIDRNPSDSDVSKAVSHAKNRGVWAIGVVEEIDVMYVSQ